MALIAALLIIIVGLLVQVGLATQAAPSAAPRETQVVYTAWAYSGPKYLQTFYPQSTDTLYLVGNVDSALVLKLTQVYYWPLTLEYRPDYDALNQQLIGVIEISRNGAPVAQIKPISHTVLYSEITPRALAFGADAQVRYEDYLKEARGSAAAIDAYYQASARYEAAYEAYLDQIKAGNLTARSPGDLPSAPPSVKSYATQPELGYRINLPPGDYDLRLLTPDGAQAVAGTNKKVHVFSPRRQGIGYKVFSGQRWTETDSASDPQAALYVAPPADLYLEPYAMQEFESYDYAKLTDPQHPAVGHNSWEWVLTDPVTTGRLRVTSAGAQPTVVDYQAYSVIQKEGSALGYDIVPFKADANRPEPDFQAFKVPLPAGSRPERMSLETPAGQPLSSSQREIVAVGQPRTQPLYALAIAPLVVGLAAISWRRVKTGANGRQG